MNRPALALVAAAALSLGAAAAWSQPDPVDDLLLQSKIRALQLREGRYELAAQSIAALEPAVAAHPKDARLWNALGVAYFQQITASFRAGDVAAIPDLLRKATAAHGKALEIAPDDPEALSGHGTGLAIASGFTRRPEMGQQGLAEMDRAVALAPDNTLVRLQHAFTSLGVGAPLLQPEAVEADLKHLIALSEGSRQADVLHVILGDLRAENGDVAGAQAEYAVAARPASKVREMGSARLAAAPTASEIARLRSEIGRNCVMCHAP